VKTDPEYNKARERLIQAESDRDYLRGVLDALRTKREAAVSLGAQLRQEHQSDTHLRERRELERGTAEWNART